MEDQRTNSDQTSVMPLGDHLEELRTRLIQAFLGLIPILVVSLVFGQSLLGFLLYPLQDALLASGQIPAPQAVGPLETFSAYVKVSLIAAVIVGSPWLMWQLWLFISPGLYPREKRFVYFLLPLSTLLTTSGLIFLFKVVMPLLLMFFIGFGSQIGVIKPNVATLPDGITLPSLPVLRSDPANPVSGQMWVNIERHELRIAVDAALTPDVTDPAPSADTPPAVREPSVLSIPLHKPAGIRQDYRVGEYLSLLLSLSLAFSVAFQTPVVVLLLGWAGFIDNAFLSKYRRHSLFGCAVVAAFLTPGDVTSMIMLWVPLYALYELGGLLLRLFPAHRVAAGLAGREPPDAAA
ncbi:MAG: preprotein translocase subunit TatC [Phycisphaeraceae bacterium]|nr:preprotein translocase subunit TatC [Phycisphaeraceae bacterium]